MPLAEFKTKTRVACSAGTQSDNCQINSSLFLKILKLNNNILSFTQTPAKTMQDCQHNS
jgi:hypothetical protein